jgi:multiple sugar transport system permease protein
VGFLSLFLYPLVASIYYSLTRYDLLTPPWFVGLENYRQLFADKLVRKALYNTAYLSWCIVPLNNLAGLVLALLLDTRLRLQSFFRTIFYLPSLVPVVALSVMWRYILDPNFGLLNGILAAMGLPGQGWLSNPHLSKPSLVLISMWGVGGVTILYLAALQGVPVSLYEAARIDGASQRHCIWHITIPMISPTILFCVITGLIGTFQYFTQAYMLTPWGGAAYSTLTYAVYLFENAFSWMRMGYASAMAWVLFGVTSVLTLLLFRTSARWVYYGYGSDR